MEENRQLNPLEQQIAEMYKRKDIPNNPTCRRCREAENGPKYQVGAWFVGDHFSEQNKRILFIGKTARGDIAPAENDLPEKEEPGGFNRYRMRECARNQLWNTGWAYWRYTRDLCCEYFGLDDVNEAREKVAFTNLIKCNNSDHQDTTTPYTIDCCIKKLNIIGEEIKILNPTHVVIYAADDYDEAIENVFHTDSKRFTITCKHIGKRSVRWREADVNYCGMKIHVIQTGHPERKKKKDFIDEVIKSLNRSMT